jgi:drug/metabolite transporter (DMT)-like permease
MSASRALSGAAFATLLLIALMMGGNHVAARLAFNNGVDVATAVVFRSAVTAMVLFVLLRVQRVPFGFDKLSARQKRFLPLIGLLIGFQSLSIYSSVARLPVALALLAFNTYPLCAAFWDRVLYGKKPERAMLIAMPVILVGLALALDVFGAASGLGASAQWAQIGVGVAFAVRAALLFGLAMILTQHEITGLDGRVRTFTTLSTAGLVAIVSAALHGGLQLPNGPGPSIALGWVGLGMLTFLYGTAFTIMFTVLPKLGVAGNSAIMNVEPVFALALAWLILGQAIAPIQVVGALIVVAAVMVLGLRRGKP